MPVTQSLVDAAMAQARQRFPTGYGGAAALQTQTGEILTSVCFDALNDAVHLCHETGAICEANRLGLAVTASVCVSRASESEEFVILTPCGVCQERLATWGLDVHAAVPLPEDPSRWESRPLRELQPFFWRNAFE